jgi:hypothetical protein
MTIGNPSKPARTGRLVNTEADIYTMTAATGNGGVGYGTYNLTHSNIPSIFQPMSSSESQRYGSLSEETLYEIYLPTVSMDGTDITVTGAGSAWQFRINGVTYEAISAGVKQRDGMQKVALKRVSG